MCQLAPRGVYVCDIERMRTDMRREARAAVGKLHKGITRLRDEVSQLQPECISRTSDSVCHVAASLILDLSTLEPYEP